MLREIEIENDKFLSTKYENIFELYEDMTKERKKNRPDCKKILEIKNSWAMSINDCKKYEVFNEILRNNFYSYDLAKNFHETFFIRKFCLEYPNFDKSKRRTLQTSISDYYSNFSEIKYLGCGSYGIVFHVEHKKSKGNFAMKKVATDRVNNIYLLREVKMLSMLSSDYVVELITHWNESNYYLSDYDAKKNLLPENFLESHNILKLKNEHLFHLQMELCHCTLRTFLINNVQLGILSKETMFFIATEIMREILVSVDYLHKQSPPIIHRDLKPSNILLTESANGRFVKLADFGSAILHEHEAEIHTNEMGSPKYMAPEVRNGSGIYDTKADIYSLGVTISELFNIDINE
jgi:serine/threonine protein kinase